MLNITEQFYNCVVYCIINKNKKLIYYGSTTQTLKNRICHHKKPSNDTSSKILFENEDPKNIEVKVLLRDNFKTIRDLHIQEKLFIKNHSCSSRNIYNVINEVIPTRSKREYYLDNRKQIIERNKRWAKDNKDKVNEMARRLYHKHREKRLQKIDCECGAKVCKTQIKRHHKSLKHQLYLKNLELEKLKKEIENEKENEKENQN